MRRRHVALAGSGETTASTPIPGSAGSTAITADESPLSSNTSPENEKEHEHVENQTQTTQSQPSSGTPFDCNICLDTPNDPVVTACGHLYCWSCLYKWMRLHAESPQCPVCKSSVERHKVTPIYGRGRSSSVDPRLSPPSTSSEALPPRPAGHRDAAAPQMAAPPFGIHPAAFGRINAYGNYSGNLSLSTFGLFPNLFGMQIAYPHINDTSRDVPNLTPEQENHEQVARVFLFLTFFIICCISFF